MTISQTELKVCLNVLQQVADDPSLIDHHEQFKALVAKVHRQGKKHKKQVQRESITSELDQQKVEDRQLAQQALIVQQNNTQALPTANKKYHQPHKCYVCKQLFTELHAFYHRLCPACAELNYQKRQQRADLTNRVALITGGRIKSGFEAALKFLRDGARVLITTRFPKDARQRFTAEQDYGDWSERLEIHGLDLRDLASVERFAQRLGQELAWLDILIHNAAQTVKRPLSFYRSLLEQERESTPILLEARSGYRGELPGTEHYFPLEKVDHQGQQLDLRFKTSWRTRLGEIESIEMIEVFLVNSIAPLMLTNHLLPLMLRSPHARRFVVNVSSVEGIFTKEDKSSFHPHTNMTKAALNMLTKTVGEELSNQGLFVNAVDPGWFSDERPTPIVLQAQEEFGFHPPLDAIDAAARIYDPIVQGLVDSQEPVVGKYLKDYSPRDW